jgi:plasmid stabilization system protein ParE
VIYTVISTEEARRDIKSLYCHIAKVYGMPRTADRYEKGILTAIESLAYHPCSFPVNPYVQVMCGKNARHIRYKKMAIIYTVEGDIVCIRRVMPESLIH